MIRQSNRRWRTIEVNMMVASKGASQLVTWSTHHTLKSPKIVWHWPSCLMALWRVDSVKKTWLTSWLVTSWQSDDMTVWRANRVMSWLVAASNMVTLPHHAINIYNKVAMWLASDRKQYQKPRKDLILMRNCSSCLIITASSISSTGSKNGVLGGDKQVYYRKTSNKRPRCLFEHLTNTPPPGV